MGGQSKLTLPPSNVFHRMKDVFPLVKGDYTASNQAVIQIISLAVTLGFALLGGLIVGKIKGISITS